MNSYRELKIALWGGLLFLLCQEPSMAGLVPPLQRRQIGAHVIEHFDRSRVPLSEVVLSFPCGTRSEEESESGVTEWMAAMLTRRTALRTEEELRTVLDDAGARIAYDVGRENLLFVVQALADRSQEVLNVLFEMLRSPIFENPAVLQDKEGSGVGLADRLRQQQFQGLVQQMDQPASFADRVFINLLQQRWGEPFRPAWGRVEALKRLDIPKVRQRFASCMVSPVRALVVGDKDSGSLVQLLEGFLSKWPSKVLKSASGEVPSRLVGKSRERVATKTQSQGEDASMPSLVLVDRPGVSQAEIRWGFRGPLQGFAQDEYLEILENMLTGPHHSWLQQDLREKTSLVYAVQSTFFMDQYWGHFVVQTSTKLDNAVAALKALENVMEQLRHPVEARDRVRFEEAKAFALGSYPRRFSDLFETARLYFASRLVGLPEDYLDKYHGKLKEARWEGFVDTVSSVMKKPEVLILQGPIQPLELALKKAKISYIKKDPSLFL